jgi:hypothetical protein
MTKQIELTQNKIALVDDEDFEWINQWKWTLAKRSNLLYAYRHSYHLGRLHPENIYMHRLISGVEKGETVDHINGDEFTNLYSGRKCKSPNKMVNK